MYDKLKPYGLCIRGGICGFSRHILWLNVYHTNNDPRVNSGYFLEAVKSSGGCPRIVRGDCGTENVNVRVFQLFFRRHCSDSEVSRAYISGECTSNQPIESFWGILRRTRMNYWIELLKSLDDRGLFSGSFLDNSLIQVAFTTVIDGDGPCSRNLKIKCKIWTVITSQPATNGITKIGSRNMVVSANAQYQNGQKWHFPTKWPSILGFGGRGIQFQNRDQLLLLYFIMKHNIRLSVTYNTIHFRLYNVCDWDSLSSRRYGT